MLGLDPRGIQFTEFGHNSLTPISFWPSMFPFSRWSPSQSNFRDIQTWSILSTWPSHWIRLHLIAKPHSGSQFLYIVLCWISCWARKCGGFCKGTHCGRTQLCSCQSLWHASIQSHTAWQIWHYCCIVESWVLRLILFWLPDGTKSGECTTSFSKSCLDVFSHAVVFTDGTPRYIRMWSHPQTQVGHHLPWSVQLEWHWRTSLGSWKYWC